jgi:hypothetical protein
MMGRVGPNAAHPQKRGTGDSGHKSMAADRSVPPTWFCRAFPRLDRETWGAYQSPHTSVEERDVRMGHPLRLAHRPGLVPRIFELVFGVRA